MSNLNWRKHLIPREHGAWAMWIVPFIIGMFASGGFTIQALQVFLSTLLVFFARSALGSAVRLRERDKSTAAKCLVIAAIELLAAILCVISIVLEINISFIVVSGLAGLILLADLFWVRDRMERNLGIELIGVAGFVITGPAVYLANTGQWQVTAIWLWLFSFVYFAGSVFYVKLRLARTAVKGKIMENEQKYARLIIAYTLVISVILIVMAGITNIAGWFLLGYIPWFLYLLINGFKPAKNLNRIGWVLIVHSLYFTTVLSMFFVLSSGQ